jgi:acylphosphatase
LITGMAGNGLYGGEGMKIRVSIVVHGRVQGVAFRHYTCLKAHELGVAGWVRNLPDGSVEALLEGEEPAVDSLVVWCQDGPPAARVDRLEIHPGIYRAEYDDFRVVF